MVDFIFETIIGGVIIILIGVLLLILTFSGNREMSSGNIKLFMSGVSFIIFGAIIVLKNLNLISIMF